MNQNQEINSEDSAPCEEKDWEELKKAIQQKMNLGRWINAIKNNTSQSDDEIAWVNYCNALKEEFQRFNDMRGKGPQSKSDPWPLMVTFEQGGIWFGLNKICDKKDFEGTTSLDQESVNTIEQFRDRMKNHWREAGGWGKLLGDFVALRGDALQEGLKKAKEKGVKGFSSKMHYVELEVNRLTLEWGQRFEGEKKKGFKLEGVDWEVMGERLGWFHYPLWNVTSHQRHEQKKMLNRGVEAILQAVLEDWNKKEEVMQWEQELKNAINQPLPKDVQGWIDRWIEDLKAEDQGAIQSRKEVLKKTGMEGKKKGLKIQEDGSWKAEMDPEAWIEEVLKSAKLNREFKADGVLNEMTLEKYQQWRELSKEDEKKMEDQSLTRMLEDLNRRGNKYCDASKDTECFKQDQDEPMKPKWQWWSWLGHGGNYRVIGTYEPELQWMSRWLNLERGMRNSKLPYEEVAFERLYEEGLKWMKVKALKQVGTAAEEGIENPSRRWMWTWLQDGFNRRWDEELEIQKNKEVILSLIEQEEGESGEDLWKRWLTERDGQQEQANKKGSKNPGNQVVFGARMAIENEALSYALAIGEKLGLEVKSKPVQHVMGDLKKVMEERGFTAASWKAMLKHSKVTRSMANQIFGIKVNEWLNWNRSWVEEKVQDFKEQVFRDRSSEVFAQKKIKDKNVEKIEWTDQLLKWAQEWGWNEEITAKMLRIGLDVGWYEADLGFERNRSLKSTYFFKEVMEHWNLRPSETAWDQWIDEKIRASRERREELERGTLEQRKQERFKSMLKEWAKLDSPTGMIKTQWESIRDLINEFPNGWDVLDSKNPLKHALNWHDEWIKDAALFKNINRFLIDPEANLKWNGIWNDVEVNNVEVHHEGLKSQKVESLLKDPQAIEAWNEWKKDYEKDRIQGVVGWSQRIQRTKEEHKEKKQEEPNELWLSAWSKRELEFKELTSRLELMMEGDRMHHCVGGSHFAELGASGMSKFFHIKDCKSLEESTLMLSRQEGGWKVEQHHGKHNASVKSLVIKSFAKELIVMLNENDYRWTQDQKFKGLRS